jgi:23S rRNA pseudouridine1911/1915/1917 synthase
VRLDLLLISRQPGLSRRKAREVIEKGQVDVDGHCVLEPGASVPASAHVEFHPNRRARSRARLSLTALYEDDTLLVVDKPAGLLSVPSVPGADQDSVLARVKSYMARRRPRGGYVGVVHRLDRDTSGALALALTQQARVALRTLFREHRIERRYLTLVAGVPRQDAGEVRLPIRDAYRSGRRGVARGEEPAKPALTRYRVLERFRAAALLEVELETGRQHQIRIHLAELRLPVVGDSVYGGDMRPPTASPRQLLHASRLGFAHPISGEAVRVESPLPDDFAHVLRRLRAQERSGG